MKDVIIIGAGPAGMTAAIYAHAAGLSVMLVEKSMYGGQMAVSSVIENYPGVGSISGYELSDMMHKQVESCGISIINDTVRSIEKSDGHFRVVCDGGENIGKCVIVANGVTRREAGFIGEREFIGRGVSYCAVCDGAFFRDCDVCVIGGGNSALEEALYLSVICRNVYIVHRRETFRGDEKYVRAVEAAPNITRYMSHTPQKISGEGKLSSIEIESTVNGKITTLNVAGVFVSVGLVPDNARFADVLTLTEDGYILSDEECMTNTEGIFVCGDTRNKKIRQITTAVSDGAIAATHAAEYVRNCGKLELS